MLSRCAYVGRKNETNYFQVLIMWHALLVLHGSKWLLLLLQTVK